MDSDQLITLAEVEEEVDEDHFFSIAIKSDVEESDLFFIELVCASAANHANSMFVTIYGLDSLKRIAKMFNEVIAEVDDNPDVGPKNVKKLLKPDSN